MTGRGHSTLCLILVTIAVGYAVITRGGDGRGDSGIVLLSVGLSGVLASIWLFRQLSASAPERLIEVTSLLLPAIVACQLIPLPLTILTFAAPTRAELAKALGGVTAVPQFAPLTISIENTSLQLARITGCVLVFFIVRQIVQVPGRRWIAAAPLILIGALEAAAGLSLRLSDGSAISGTYFNKNHFAGLLEMVLPFALMSAIAVLYRNQQRAEFATSSVLVASGLAAVSLGIFTAILFSLSKMGFVSALGSFAAMALVGVTGRLAFWGRWMLIGLVVVSVAAAFLFVPPLELVHQFGGLASDQPSEGRVPIWRDVVTLIRAYPLFGIGLGNLFPGLLRYQTSGVEFAWINAHNDYLQLPAELGLFGALIIAALMASVYAGAVRAGFSGPTRDTRLVGIACTGALTAILLHSSADFNAYILANALVLSWIAGMSAGLRRANSHTKPKPPVRMQYPIRAFVGIAGCLVTVYGAASLLFVHIYAADPHAERVFCRFGVCDTDGALVALRRTHGVDTTGSLPPGELLIYLSRDPAAPYRWEDVGEAMQKAGRTQEAGYCFSRAVALAPNSPPTLLTAANFHFDRTDTRIALDLASRSLQGGGRFDEAVLGMLEERHVAVDEVLQHVVTNERSSQMYFRRLLTRTDTADAEQAWNWMISRGYVDDRLAADYVEFLLRRRNPDAAASGWALYTAGRSPGYPESNRVFNGDFESDPTGCRFDWRIDAPGGAATGFDGDVRYSGSRSLRIRFDGSKNLGEIGVEQMVFLKAGHYQFRAYVRTREISTDQGVAFRVVFGDAPQFLDFTTEHLRASNDWTLVERGFDAPRGGLVRVSVVRRPSLRFDNLVRGTVWVDHVSISAVEDGGPGQSKRDPRR
jgi:O-antigen ligase